MAFLGLALVLGAGLHVGEGQALSSAVCLRLLQPLEEQGKAEEAVSLSSMPGLFQTPLAPSASRQQSGPVVSYSGLGGNPRIWVVQSYRQG